MNASITDGFDYGILEWLDSIHNPILTEIFKVLTNMGEYGAVWIIIGIVLFINKKTRHIGLTLAIAVLLSLAVSNGIIKNLAARSRPCWLNPDVNMLIAIPKDYSFPSGHASAGFASAVSICMWNRRYGIAAIILAALIAASRMYFYVHFPTDIIAGIVLGTVYAVIAYIIVRYVKPVANLFGTQKPD